MKPRNQFVLATLVVLCAASIYSHVRLWGNDDAKGFLQILDHLFDFFLTGSLTALSFCLGRKILRLFSISLGSAAEEFSMSVLLGVGGIGFGVLSFGLIGWLKPIP